jgi:hypothetical protein
MKKPIFLSILISIFALFLSSCAGKTGGPAFASIPAGLAFADGKEIYFSHTEASDPAVVEKLSAMMKSPVILVPSLAEVPDEITAPVYVFENGITGKGPLGFQADVFNFPPGTERYTPLRKIVFVNWNEGVGAKELRSEQEILDAKIRGDLQLIESDIVVNMPFMVWDGGKR